MPITRDDLDSFYGCMSQYQQITEKSAIYPGQGSPLGLMYCALKLNGEAGELAEHVGKAIRDDGYFESLDLTDEKRRLILKECGDVLWYVARILGELGEDMKEAALQNLVKLHDRQERGVLGGSGDER